MRLVACRATGGRPWRVAVAAEGGGVLLVWDEWWLAVLVLVAGGGEGSAGSGRRWWRWRWQRASGWWVAMADHDETVMTPGPWASPDTRALTRTLPVTDGGS